MKTVRRIKLPRKGGTITIDNASIRVRFERGKIQLVIKADEAAKIHWTQDAVDNPAFITDDQG